MAVTPEDYRWSSHAANAHGAPDPLVRPHASYLALGATDAARQENYRGMVAQALPDDDLQALRLHLQRQHALGSDRFRAAIEAQLGRRVGPGVIGRPRKAQDSQKNAL